MTNADMLDTLDLTGIAVIGMAGRFPGAKNIDQFWHNLQNGHEAISLFSDEELLAVGVDPALVANPAYIKAKAVLEDVEMFDAEFFGYSPKEAALMDPQQRFFLECAWEALEDAGYTAPPAPVRIGVFAGASVNTYILLSNLFGNLFTETDVLPILIGGDKDFLTTRVSYKLNLTGPSFTLQTACSTSLVAVHVACQSLLNGECDIALAGGVSIRVPRKLGYLYQEGSILSPDGHCRAFDEKAQGTVVGEGVGIVTLKRLEDAVNDGDQIWAVIKGSAINNDGSLKVGYTAPSVDGQTEVIEEALGMAGLSADTISYIEAHGTGTALGDPIEITALTRAFRASTEVNGFCAIGSVKTNIGHLDTAAGVAGLIKTILALKHRQLPPSLHFTKPNPLIDFANSPFYVNSTLRPWQSAEHPRRAGINSFGIGGTNAHVVLEEAPDLSELRPDSAEEAGDTVQILPLSARSQQALRDLARAYTATLGEATTALNLGDVCYTASLRRSHHDHRLALIGRSDEDMVDQIQAWLDQRPHPTTITGHVADGGQRKTVFVFPGQGSQWLGMGRELLAEEPVFRAALETCAQALRPYVQWSLIDQLSGTAPAQLEDIDVIQPTLWAIQVALAALWRSWGIEPHAVVGHSMGEVAAAYVAGILSLNDAARIICKRSQILRKVRGQGAMGLIGLSMSETQQAIAGYEQRLSIAVSNSLNSTVISGDPAALEEVLQTLKQRQIFCQAIKVDVASHSPQMDPLRGELLTALTGLQPQAAKLPMYSTVTGVPIDGRTCDAAYWVRNLREPVLFSTAIKRLAADEHTTFIELSPHPLLLAAISDTLEHSGHQGVALPSLRREKPERAELLQSLGALYTLGYPIDWPALSSEGATMVRLPTYPFQRQRHWVKGAERISRSGGAFSHSDTRHWLVQRRLKTPLSAAIFETQLSVAALPWLSTWRYHDLPMAPAALGLEMQLAALKQYRRSAGWQLMNVRLPAPMAIPEDGELLLQTIVDLQSAHEYNAQIVSPPHEQAPEGTPWQRYAESTLGTMVPQSNHPSLTKLQSDCQTPVELETYLQTLQTAGIEWRTGSHPVDQVLRGDGELLLRMRATPLAAGHANPTELPLMMLEALIQAVNTCFDTTGGHVYLPTTIQTVAMLHTIDQTGWGHVKLQTPHPSSGEAPSAELRLYDEAGRVCVALDNVQFRGVERAQLRREVLQSRLQDVHYHLHWQPQQHELKAQGALSGERWVILADRGGVGTRLAAQLKAQGAEPLMIDSAQDETRSAQQRVADLPQLVSDLGGEPIHGWLYLWALDCASNDQLDQQSLADAAELSASGLLRLSQLLIERNVPTKLWVLTRGSQMVAHQPSPSAAQAPSWGLGTVIGLEHPDIWGGLIDLDPSGSDDIEKLVGDIAAPNDDTQIAWRAGQRYVPRLVRSEQSAAQPITWREDRAYLITGGLGHLGLKFARWIVEQGARHVVLVGRSGLPERAMWPTLDASSAVGRKAAAVSELEALGAKLTIAEADISDLERMAAVVDAIQGSETPLGGVLHAAGIAVPEPLASLQPASLMATLKPKLVGTWVLHELTKTLPLDFFIGFSSIVAIWGSKQLAHHAAANQFLDALIQHRHATGLPGLSINWGPWTGGIHDSAEATAWWTQIGLDPFDVEQELPTLAGTLGAQTARAVVTRVDWNVFIPLYEAQTRRPLFEQLKAPQVTLATDGPADLLRRLRASKQQEHSELVMDHIHYEATRVLGLAPNHPIDPNQPLRELGLESLMAVELRNRLQTGLGAQYALPATLLFDYPTIAALTTYTLQLIATAVAAPAPETTTSATNQQAWAELDQLSDEELESSLLNELDSTGY